MIPLKERDSVEVVNLYTPCTVNAYLDGIFCEYSGQIGAFWEESCSGGRGYKYPSFYCNWDDFLRFCESIKG